MSETVSVVIPTFERPALVMRALDSVLAQTHAPLEVLVVVDGERPDPETLARLAEVSDPRLRVLPANAALGNAAARNLGIGRARAEWIALLDDDDVWHPDKLARQLQETARWRADEVKHRDALPIASCRLKASLGARHFLWPRLLPRTDETIDHYLFCRRWPLSGDRLVQTSTLLAPRALFTAVPFRDGRRFVDQDWLLRAACEADVRLLFPPGREALVEWDLSPTRRRVSDYRNWRWCIDWAREREPLLGRRARAAFLLTLASSSAADAGELDAFVPLLREAFRHGRPNPTELFTHVVNFVLSRRVRDAMAARANRLLGS